MNELDLLSGLRAEVPLRPASPATERVVLAAIAEAQRPGARTAAGRIASSRRRRRKLALAGTVTAGLAAGVTAAMLILANSPPQAIAWSGRPTAPSALSYLSFGRARTAAELAAYATRAAALAPGRAPRPDEWIFMKTEAADSTAGQGGILFGPPDKRVIGLRWIRADWREYASLDVNIPADLPPGQVVRGHLSISPGSGGTLCGWKSVGYSYLSSLPADPARLEAIILASNSPDLPCYDPGPANDVIFNAIYILLQGETEGAWIPPRLAATMYQVLQRLLGVHFDAGTDIAGRSGIGLYQIQDGWIKRELVINPVTYQFMGAEVVATQARTMDGTRNVKKGQILGWFALLGSAIVEHPGQLP